MMPPLRSSALLLVALGLFMAPDLRAQSVDWDPRAAEVTRDELSQLLERLEESAAAPGYSERLRQQAAREAAFVRARLETGDFQVGDRVILQVAGEEALSDTFTVTAGQRIELPEVGDLPLTGVLRSELQDHLEQELSRFLQEPSVRAAALIRIAVLGSVGRPGFYTVPATSLLEDALMMAGGPAGGADVDEVVIERAERTIWEGEALQNAMIEGRTLDQLSLRAGDRITVPERQPGLFEGGFIRTLLVTVPPLVYLITRLIG